MHFVCLRNALNLKNDPLKLDQPLCLEQFKRHKTGSSKENSFKAFYKSQESA